MKKIVAMILTMVLFMTLTVTATDHGHATVHEEPMVTQYYNGVPIGWSWYY